MKRTAPPWLRRHAVDVIIVLVGLGAIVELQLLDELDRERRWLLVPAALSMTLPLLARRRFPVGAPALVMVAAAAVSYAEGALFVHDPRKPG